MTLNELLQQTGDHSQHYGSEKSDAVQVFGDSPLYWRLSDYVVTAAVSGPSIILSPRIRHTQNGHKILAWRKSGMYDRGGEEQREALIDGIGWCMYSWRLSAILIDGQLELY